MMHKLLAILLGLSFLSISSQAGNEAKSVLDKTAQAIRKSGQLEINFSATTFVKQEEQGKLVGTLFLKGKKFHLTSPNLTSWFDGKTLWTLNKESDEVNLSTPNDRERQSMNPYIFVDLYKSGYFCTLTETTLRGHKCHEVYMKADSQKKSIKEMYVTIDQTTLLPLCVRMRQDAHTWIRINIMQCKTNQKYDDAQFQFNSKDFPSAVLIDLR